MSDFFKGPAVRSARAEKAIVALGKIKDKSWKSMEKAFISINEVVKSGGFSGLMGGTAEGVKEQLKTSVRGLFSPIENEINQFIANLLSDTGLGGAINKIANSFGNLVNTLADPGTGLGKAINFVGDAVANTLDFAAKGWESLLTGKNAFAREWEATILPSTGGGLLMGGESILGGGFDEDVLNRQLQSFFKDFDPEGF